MTVYKDDICRSLQQLGIMEGDTVLVHSSLKSAGYVEGGPETVIRAFLDTVGKTGNLVMPTLSQKNFEHAYEEWSMDRPSDTGLITETFRKMPGALRSNQETHSVAAMGPAAAEITGSHKSYGPLYGVFGPYPFSYSSPWQKMYDKNGKIVFFGVTMLYNTFKHFIEYRLADTLLQGIREPSLREEQKSKLQYHGMADGKDIICGSVWPYYDAVQMQKVLEAQGMVRKAPCGNAVLLAVHIRETCDFTYRLLLREYASWFPEDVVQWIDECIRLATGPDESV